MFNQIKIVCLALGLASPVRVHRITNIVTMDTLATTHQSLHRVETGCEPIPITYPYTIRSQ